MFRAKMLCTSALDSKHLNMNMKVAILLKLLQHFCCCACFVGIHVLCAPGACTVSQTDGVLTIV